ncbi:DNA ligase [Gracilariopsis chorda]|uniref:DNA ligase n=1 Tax=Gracilariopsis chorda TaxID=448386 RepID=A0A2V3IQ91_9FLOR|nr:DNA ligase [Gracilariopsis chorda]|eukprot:PXF44256.1 DNA ligase [Gracilariopsis chorda]
MTNKYPAEDWKKHAQARKPDSKSEAAETLDDDKCWNKISLQIHEEVKPYLSWSNGRAMFDKMHRLATDIGPITLCSIKMMLKTSIQALAKGRALIVPANHVYLSSEFKEILSGRKTDNDELGRIILNPNMSLTRNEKRQRGCMEVVKKERHLVSEQRHPLGHGAAARATKLALDNEVAEDEYVDAQDSFAATFPVTTKRFAQCRHNALMLSLDNAYNHAHITAFVNRALAVQSEISAEVKIDGVALSLEYQNRELCRALNRGTGRHGDDITDNVRESLMGREVVDSIPDSSAPDFLIVRGEVYITKEDLDEVNESLERSYSNPRNAATGVLKHKNLSKGKRRRLRFIAYESQCSRARND